MISGMSGNCCMICLTAVIIGHHLFVKETGLIVTCFHWGILESSSGERGKADRMTCFTKPEQKTMITLWSIFQSPLMYGGELADLDEWTLSLLTNTEVNEMHRTLDGQRQEYRDDEWIVWSGENEENTYIAIFNVSDKKKEIPDKLAEIYIKEDAKEIWSGKKATEVAEEVDSHGCVLYQMKRM